MFLVQLDTATYTVVSVTPIETVNFLSQLDNTYMIAEVAPEVGEVFDPVSKIFGAAPRRRWLTKLAFDNRFTMDEMVKIKLAQLLPTRLEGETDTDYAARCSIPMQLQVMSERRSMATYIDLERADTQQGVYALESLGLLAPGRAAEILTNPIATSEYYPEA